MSHARGRGVAPPTPQQQAPAHVAFPRMPLEEVVEDMRLFERPVTRDELRKPTPEIVRNLFSFFVEKVYGTSPDDIRQPAFGCLDVLANPELFDDAVPELHFLRACQRLFNAAQYNDFRRSDLTHPHPARLHWQISALINYAKFRESRLPTLFAKAEAEDNLRRRLEELEQSGSQIDSEIAAIEAKIAADAEDASREKQLADAKSQNVAEIEHRYKRLNDETKELKAQLQHAVDSISRLGLREMALTQEVDSLQATVLSSPERVKEEIAELEMRVASEKESILNIQQRTRETSEKAERMRRTAADVSSIVQLVDETVREMEKRNDMEQRVKEQKSKIREYEKENLSITETVSHLERQIQSMEQRLVRVRQQRDVLSTKEREVKDSLANQERAVVREIDVAKDTIEENQRKQAEVVQKMHQVVNQMAADIAEASKQMTAVERALDTHFKEITDMNELVEGDNRKAIEDLQKQIESCS